MRPPPRCSCRDESHGHTIPCFRPAMGAKLCVHCEIGVGSCEVKKLSDSVSRAIIAGIERARPGQPITVGDLEKTAAEVIKAHMPPIEDPLVSIEEITNGMRFNVYPSRSFMVEHMIPQAHGKDLDQLGALVSVTRKRRLWGFIRQSDCSYRAAIITVMRGYTLNAEKKFWSRWFKGEGGWPPP